MTTTDPWFVTERSEALAKLLLTSRNDVRIWKENQLADRLVLHVAIDTGDPVSAQLFVVQVKGTTSADQKEWMQNVGQLFRGGPMIYLPVCVFVVNVRESKAYYAWVAEPRVGENDRGVQFRQTGEFHPLDTPAVNEIVDRVKAWYASGSDILQPT